MISVTLKVSYNGDMVNLLQDIIEYTHYGILTIDENQTIVLFNSAAAAIFGYSAEEVLGGSLTMLLPKRVADIHQTHVDSFDKTHSAGGGGGDRAVSECKNLVGLRKSNEEFPCEVSISKIVFKGAKYFTAIIRDISEEVAVEIQEQEQEKQLNNYRATKKAELRNQVNKIATDTD